MHASPGSGSLQPIDLAVPARWQAIGCRRSSFRRMASQRSARFWQHSTVGGLVKPMPSLDLR
jgi:hypothetical protein